MRALQGCGITKRVSVHGLRRTFNNLSRQVAGDIVTRSITCHVTAAMTEHYSHVDAREKLQMDDLVAPPREPPEPAPAPAPAPAPVPAPPAAARATGAGVRDHATGATTAGRIAATACAVSRHRFTSRAGSRPALRGSAGAERQVPVATRRRQEWHAFGSSTLSTPKNPAPAR